MMPAPGSTGRPRVAAATGKRTNGDRATDPKRRFPPLTGVGAWLAFAAILATVAACGETPTKPDQPKPNLPDVYNLATTAYAEQNWAEAERQYTILTRESPTEVEPWFKLGNIYARTSRSELAIRAYREALVRDSQHVKSWHNMAITQLREAGKGFAEIELLVKPDDPLHAKSVKIQQAIDELVN